MKTMTIQEALDNGELILDYEEHAHKSYEVKGKMVYKDEDVYSIDVYEGGKKGMIMCLYGRDHFNEYDIYCKTAKVDVYS